MNTEDRSIREGHARPLSNPQTERAAWRPLSIAGGAGALAGLLIGIVVGRATVSDPPVSTSQKPTKEKPANEAEAEAKDAPEEPSTPPDTYRADLARHFPGKSALGFDKDVTDKRPAARIVGTDATLHFPFSASSGKSYALTSVVQLDGAEKGNVRPSLDGHPLGSWELSKGWGFYSSPIGEDLLSGEEHDIGFAPSPLDGDGAVRVDSVTVVPVEKELRFAIGGESRGHLISGFSATEGRAVWSDGPRSVMGGVLSPLASAYKAVVRCSAYTPIEPIDVRLSVNGKDVGTANVTRRVRDATWTIPAKVLHSGANLFTFEYPTTGQPAKFKPGSTDSRDLAVRFYAVDVVPKD